MTLTARLSHVQNRREEQAKQVLNEVVTALGYEPLLYKDFVLFRKEVDKIVDANKDMIVNATYNEVLYEIDGFNKYCNYITKIENNGI